jgi:hypothetical protein
VSVSVKGGLRSTTLDPKTKSARWLKFAKAMENGAAHNLSPALGADNSGQTCNLNEVWVQLLGGVVFVRISVGFVRIGLREGSEGLVEGREMSNSARFVMDLAFENAKLTHLKFIPTNSIDGNFNRNNDRGVE